MDAMFFSVLGIRIRVLIRMFLGLPDPHPDPLVTKYRSGSGSFHHQAKILRKTLISTVFLPLCDFLSLKNDVNVPVFRIRIRIFLGLPDPHPDPLEVFIRGSEKLKRKT
jgi:hypothetical protein